MKVFVTGATGHVGMAVVQELVQNGHSVLGLARSADGAEKLKKLGALPHLGSLEDAPSLKAGVQSADGIIHCAFNHDFSKFAESGRLEKQVIDLFANILRGSDRPFIATSGVAMAAPGRIATEKDIRTGETPIPRDAETPTLALAQERVHAMVVRLSVTTHGEGKGGFAGLLSDIARAKGLSAYVGKGENLWPAVNRLDAAKVYRLALEKGTAGSIFHAVSEQGLRTKDIAEAIGQALGVPTRSLSGEEADMHFGGFKNFAMFDTPASSEFTKEWLGWKPENIGLLQDLRINLKP